MPLTKMVRKPVYKNKHAERGGKTPQKEENMSLADMTKTIRQETGMSQKQLAEKIGTNQTEVSFIERGFIPLNPEKQIVILNIFNEVIKGEKTLKEKENNKK